MTALTPPTAEEAAWLRETQPGVDLAEVAEILAAAVWPGPDPSRWDASLKKEGAGHVHHQCNRRRVHHGLRVAA